MQLNQEIESPITKTIYKLLKTIGSGTYAQCWSAINVQTNEQVCLKIVEFYILDESQQKQVEQEACIHATLVMDNIVRFHECFYLTNEVEQKYFIIVMELAEGSLDTFLISNPTLSTQQLMHMFLDIALSIQYLHNRHIIHRDISAKNLLIFTKNNQITLKLCDFGVSAMSNFASTQIGTPQTMAPEIFDGKYSEKVDIWAAACVFYQLVYLDQLFKNMNCLALIQHLQTFQKPSFPFSSLEQQFTQFAEGLITKMMAPLAEDRINSSKLCQLIKQKLNVDAQTNLEDQIFGQQVWIDFDGKWTATNKPPALNMKRIPTSMSNQTPTEIVSKKFSQTKRLNIEELKKQSSGMKKGGFEVQIFTGLEKEAEEKVNRGE